MPAAAADVRPHGAAEAGHPRATERLSPDGEELAEGYIGRSQFEHPGRLARSQRVGAAPAAHVCAVAEAWRRYADARRYEHHSATGEQLEVDAVDGARVFGGA